jgi:hypothetical protein
MKIKSIEVDMNDLVTFANTNKEMFRSFLGLSEDTKIEFPESDVKVSDEFSSKMKEFVIWFTGHRYNDGGISWNKISTIKDVRMKTGLGLHEAKKLVEEINEIIVGPTSESTYEAAIFEVLKKYGACSLLPL